MKALLDTNILIDYLNGIERARTEINRYSKAHISIITWMEVMAGVNEETEQSVRQFLNRFVHVELSPDIAERTIEIRRKFRLKLPDAIIWATAQHLDALLVTRNKKDFPPDEPSVRMPYDI